MSLKPKVAHKVQNQILPVFAESYLHKFLEAYYSFLEQQGVAGALHYLRNALEIKDIDTAPDHIVKQVVYSIISNYKQLNVEPRLLVKNLKAIFSSKGSEQSYKFMMQSLFGEEADIKWGRDSVFKASSFEYDQDVVMVAIAPFGIQNINFDGNMLYRKKTDVNTYSSVIIDNTTTVAHNGKDYLRLSLVKDTLRGTFDVDDVVYCECRNNGLIECRLVGQHGGLTIINSGSLYKIGDKIKFVGADGDAHITEVSAGKVQELHIIDPGYGYKPTDTIKIEHFLGQGLNAIIANVDGVDGAAVPNMRLTELIIEDGGVNYQLNDEITIDCGTQFTAVVTGVATSAYANSLILDNLGSDYKYSRLSLYTESNSIISDVINLTYNLSDFSGQTIKFSGPKENVISYATTPPSYNYDPDTNLSMFEVMPEHKVAVNGYGGDVWIANLAPVTFGYTAGFNYVQPVVKLQRTSSAKIDVPITTGSIGAISISGGSASGIQTAAFTADCTNNNKFFTVDDISKFKSGYSVRFSNGFHAKVTNIEISSSTVTINKALSFTNPAISGTVYQEVLTLSEKFGSGANITIGRLSGKVTSLSVPNVVTSVITDTECSGGHGYGLTVSPYFDVDSMTITNRGSEYSRCNVNFVGGHGEGCDINFVVDDGCIHSVPVTTIGSGYTYAKVIPNADNIGSGAALRAVISSGAIVSIIVDDPGHRYTGSDGFTIVGDGINAVLGAPVTRDGAIRKAFVKNAGFGYYPVTNLSVYHSGFDLGLATATVNIGASGTPEAGQITGLNLDASGLGYDAAMTEVYIIGDGYNADVSATISGGIVTGFTVDDPGFGYTYATCRIVHGNQAVFDVKVSQGKVESIRVVDIGSGYKEDPQFQFIPDFMWYPPEPGIMEQMFPLLDHYRLFAEPIGIPMNASGTAALSTGSLKSVSLVASGEGYYNWDKPVQLVVVDPFQHGRGARLYPLIDRNSGTRNIKDIIILNGGSKYSDATRIEVRRGTCPAGLDAVLLPVIVDGVIVDVIIDAAGSNYYSGTYHYVNGNGTGGTIALDINSGIQHVYVDYYVHPGAKPDVVITDIKGTGCDIDAVWNGDRLEGFTIVNPGSGYVDPVISLGTGETYQRFDCVYGTISNISIVSPGNDYTNANVVILSDTGYGAVTETEFTTLRQIDSLTVQNRGFRYGSVPQITFTDDSGMGRISKVKILDSGYGYKKLPALTIETTSGKNGLIVPYGEDIGAVKSVQITDFGIDVDSDTAATASINVLNKNINRYMIGEIVFNKDFEYHEDDYSDGPTGVLSEMDNSVAYLKIKTPPVKVAVETENGDVLISDTGEILIEASQDIGINWKTDITQISINPIRYDRFEGVFHPTAIAYHAPKLVRSNSILNRDIKLTNSKNIQDFAYTVNTGVDIKFWRDIIGELLHPSGYGMYGQIVDQNFVKRSVKAAADNEFGTIAEDIIWLYINLSDPDSIARMRMDYVNKWLTIIIRLYVDVHPETSEFLTVLHNTFQNMEVNVSPMNEINWRQNKDSGFREVRDLGRFGFKSWYPYETMETYTIPSELTGYTFPTSYWTEANTGIEVFKDMKINDYLTSQARTNIMPDSFMLIKPA